MELQKKEAVQQSTYYVLLVEDDMTGRKTWRVQLYQLGCQVEIAQASPFCITRRG